MPQYTYPHVIDNGAGEQIVFVRRTPGPHGDRLEVESVVKQGAGPPMHIHHFQEEALTVQQGRMGYQRPGEAPKFAEPGETVTFKAGEAHKFWNAGDGDLRCSGYVEPAHNLEYFLTMLYDSVKQSGSGRPGLLDAAFLMTRYRSEFAMLEIPAAVQRFVFPLQVALGRALGKYRRFHDAPAPIRR